jgi:3-oxoacyl-[acyl-carrier protein] reductase
MDLKNQTAIVTGAGKGIGKAIATYLAREGVNVGLIARTARDIEQLAEELSQSYGVRARGVSVDISVRSDVEKGVEELHNSLGPADILVNNAGIGSFGKLMDMPPEEWERMIQVNVLGTYYVTRAVLPQMLEKNRGNIINISSTSGERGAATTTAYSASKFAIMGLTESLMQELRKNNIRVTALTPSTVNTQLAADAGLPIGDEEHMMQPEDIAEFVVDILKLPHRVFIKQAGLWMTNPQ